MEAQTGVTMKSEQIPSEITLAFKQQVEAWIKSWLAAAPRNKLQLIAMANVLESAGLSLRKKAVGEGEESANQENH